jgi:hypothetical protein
MRDVTLVATRSTWAESARIKLQKRDSAALVDAARDEEQRTMRDGLMARHEASPRRMPRCVLHASVVLIACTSQSMSAGTPIPAPDAATISRDSFTWNQAEREFGFAHWDEIYPARVVARGHRVRPLPIGRPIAALAPGTVGSQELERFITEEKVAGMLVLQDGGVRPCSQASSRVSTTR